MNTKDELLRVLRDGSMVDIKNNNYAEELRDWLSLFVESDVGKNGDLTSRAIGHGDKKALGKIISKDNGILSGIQELDYFINKMKKDYKIEINFLKQDGDVIKKGDLLIMMIGKAQYLLLFERIMLNLLQRMSGISTLTKLFIDFVPSDVLTCCTRKTNWGALDKRACLVGGGGTHRMNLSDAILVKNNHVNLFEGDYFELLNNLNFGLKSKFIDLEVRTEKEADTVFSWISKNTSNLEGRTTIIMFDNFKVERIKNFIRKCKHIYELEDIYFEASGGISMDNIEEYGKSGVDILSIGELTHSVKALDISMEIMPN